jgi:serine/threonine protein kinase
MGEVYRARDPRLGREVAVKVLSGDVASDPERLARFEREARAVAALSHPNVLTVFDVGTHPAGDTAGGSVGAAVPYVVTELLEGETLRELVSRRSPTQRQVLSFAVQVARGLDAAHEKGIVHRDLKPENVFVTTDGRAKVLDVGLAKLVDRLAGDSAEPTEASPTGGGSCWGPSATCRRSRCADCRWTTGRTRVGAPLLHLLQPMPAAIALPWRPSRSPRSLQCSRSSAPSLRTESSLGSALIVTCASWGSLASPVTTQSSSGEMAGCGSRTREPPSPLARAGPSFPSTLPWPSPAEPASSSGL